VIISMADKSQISQLIFLGVEIWEAPLIVDLLLAAGLAVWSIFIGTLAINNKNY